MKHAPRIKRAVANRVVTAFFLLIVGFYAVANLVIEPFGKPLEPIAEALFVGFWTFRTEFLIGGFLTQLVLVWVWFAIYAYLLAIVISLAYRGVARTVASEH